MTSNQNRPIPKPRLLIIGCGYIGHRVAMRALSQQWEVHAVTRQRQSQLASVGIQPILADIRSPWPKIDLPSFDYVLYAVGWDRLSGASFQEIYLDGLQNVLAGFLPSQKSAKWIYVSSTSVYGDLSGEIVNEDTPTKPDEENGKIVLAAETKLRTSIPDSIILRHAGIYGPERIIRKKSIVAGEAIPANPDGYLNLIHADDSADIILRAFAQIVPGSTYLVADGHPVTRRNFYEFMAKILHAPPVQWSSKITGEHRANRRIDNAKLINDLHLNLRYPNYQLGLTQAVAEEKVAEEKVAFQNINSLKS